MGPVPNAGLALRYGTAEVLALPSLEDGMAMVMAVSMVCGCPVIATCNTGADDLLEDGKAKDSLFLFGQSKV